MWPVLFPQPLSGPRVPLLSVCAALVAAGITATPAAHAQTTLIAPGVLQFGDQDLDGYGYPPGENPTAGTSLIGLSAGTVNLATSAYSHGFPFDPSAGDYAGTDQIYVGTTQTGADDGYSQYSGRINGPQVVTFNYGSLVGVGQTVTSLTLGIAADDFQFPAFGNPFTASINGVVNAAITNQLNALTQTGPYEQFFSVGIAPAALSNSNVLTVSINEGGDGGDGWSTDFFTIGVQTHASGAAVAPEPGSIALLALSGLPVVGMVARRRRGQTLLGGREVA